MQTRSFVLAATLAALFALTNVVSAQFGPSAGPYGYPGMGGPSAPYGISHMGGGSPYGMPNAMAAYQPEPDGGPPAPVSCGEPTCGCEGNGGCGCNDCCCCPGWCHRIQVFGEFLYLRPRNAEIAYAVGVDNVPTNGPGGNQDVPVTPVQVVDPDYQGGFRTGIGFTLNECSAVVATYTHYEANTADDIVIPGGIGVALTSLVSVPFPINAAASYLDAAAFSDFDLDILDVDYKGLIAYDCNYKVNYLIGARYAALENQFNAVFTTVGFEQVYSAVQFDGAGLKLGLEGEVYSANQQWFAYGKGAASYVGGEFRTRYVMGSSVDPLITDTAWEAGRLVSIYDLEVGIGWRNECDNFRLSVGYMYNTWFNVVKNNEWINAVQNNNYVDPSDNFNGMITFDGFTFKAELLW